MLLASPVVEAWSESNTLMARAISGRLALTPNANISRGDLVCNDEVLIPILKHQGLRTTLDMIAEEVEMFMAYARPKGKPALTRPGAKCRCEAWKIKRLVSVFSRGAKRGHFPRGKGIRRIYELAEIPLPSDPRPLAHQ